MQQNRNRKKFRAVAAAAGLILSLCLSFSAGAQKLPSKITWIVPFGLGGGAGTSALVLAPRLQEKLSGFGVKDVQVVSLPGAGGIIGVKRLYDSPGDGSVIGTMLPAGGLAQSAIRDVGFDLVKFKFLGKITTSSRFIFVKGDSPFRSFDELIAEGRKRPLKFSSTGASSPSSFLLANLTDKTGMQVKEVTGYKSGRQLVVAVARGDVDATIKTSGGVVTFINSGEVRGLIQFSTNEDKDPNFPNVPSAEELGRKDLLPGGLLYILVAAPPTTPKEIVDVMSSALYQSILESKKELVEKAQVVFSPATGEQTTKLVGNLVKDFSMLISLYKKQQR